MNARARRDVMDQQYIAEVAEARRAAAARAETALFTLTTEQATQRLARSMEVGGSDVCDDWMDRAIRAGDDWKWNAAEWYLRKAYASLGATPPDDLSGYQWHCGATAIQRAVDIRLGPA